MIFILMTTGITSCFGTSGYLDETDRDDEEHVYLENKSASSTSILATRFERLMPEVVSQHEFVPEEIARVEEILGYDVASGEGMNVSFNEVNSQMSYIIPENENELLPLFYSLFNYAGKSVEPAPGDDVHAILLSGDRIYEIISPDCFVGEALRDTVEVDSLQEIKLTGFNTAGKVDFLSERLTFGQELEDESIKIGIELESALVQELYFPDENETVSVFFYHPDPNIDILEAGDRLVAYNSSENGVLILDNYLVLVESDDIDIINSVYRFIAITPPTLRGINRFKVDLVVNPGPDGTLPIYTNWNRTRFEWVTEYRLDPVDDSLSIGTLSNAMEEITGLVEFTMSVPTGAIVAKKPEEIGPYLEPTARWPTENELVKDALSEALSEVEGEGMRGQVDAIRAWVAENIAVQNSEYNVRTPVEDVIQSRSGNQWGRTDLFIAMTRAAGLPSREVAGHMYRGGFVVWAQVWLEDEMIWLDVDIGLDQVGVDSYHIPLWGTRDGEMEFVYAAWPVIKRLS